MRPQQIRESWRIRLGRARETHITREDLEWTGGRFLPLYLYMEDLCRVARYEGWLTMADVQSYLEYLQVNEDDSHDVMVAFRPWVATFQKKQRNKRAYERRKAQQ